MPYSIGMSSFRLQAGNGIKSIRFRVGTLGPVVFVQLQEGLEPEVSRVAKQHFYMTEPQELLWTPSWGSLPGWQYSLCVHTAMPGQ